MKEALQKDNFYKIINYAIKAPSGHNTQPWFFAIYENSIIITPNFERSLPAVDPNNRELFISLGCAVENLCIAANHYGYESQTDINSEWKITVTLNKNSEIIPDTLFEQISIRQTNRLLYNGNSIYQSILDDVIIASQTDSVKIQVFERNSLTFDILKNLVLEGNSQQLNNKNFKQELISWIRYNKKDTENTLDGLSYAVMWAPNLPKWITKPIIKFLLNSKSQNKADSKKIDSSSHLLLITSNNDLPETWVKVGIALEHLLLLLTKNGIASAYLNQPCEVENLRKKIIDELSLNDKYPQLLLRIGYAEPITYSKRKPIQEIIK